MVLTVLVLGMLLLGNYNLVEGATNATTNANCTVDNATAGSQSSLGPKNGNVVSDTFIGAGQANCKLYNQNKNNLKPKT